MNCSQIKSIYEPILPKNVFHFEARSKPNKYIVWAEDGQAGATHADNSMDIQVISGTTDYFTKEDYDPNVDLIQKAMNDAKLSWGLESIQYEENTKYIHYEWTWEVPNQIG